MSERERERDKIKKKGIPIAEIGADVIWDDPKLKVPFTSNPFISRMKGSAILNMAISFGLYYNELAKKWMPITSATMTESMVKSRFYPEAPDGLTELSDNPMRSDANQNLMVVNKDVPLLVSDLTFLDTTKLSVKDIDLETKLELVRLSNNSIKNQTDKLDFLETTKLSVKDASLNTTMDKLNFLETTKLSVKDASLETLITAIDGVLDTIQAQTDKLQFDGSNNLKCIIG